MAYYILIHTSLDEAFVAISQDDRILGVMKNAVARNHGAFLHDAMQALMSQHHLPFSAIAAIGVTNGPGSYTGIRVGLSAAKGLAYALNIPMVPVNTLEAIAATAIRDDGGTAKAYVALIHARQYEYYAAVYDAALKTVSEPSLFDAREQPLQIADMDAARIWGIGTGSWNEINEHTAAREMKEIDVAAFAKITAQYVDEGRIVCASEAVPAYLKEAFIISRK